MRLRKKVVKKMSKDCEHKKTEVSIFHDGEKILCITKKVSFYAVDGIHVTDSTRFYVAYDTIISECDDETFEGHYSSILKKYRKGEYLEEKYEYGYRVERRRHWSEPILPEERFGEEPPPFWKFQRLLEVSAANREKERENEEEKKRAYYRRWYPCKECRGEGYVYKFIGYSIPRNARVWIREIHSYKIIPNSRDFSREAREVPEYDRRTCPACGGRGYDIATVLLKEK